MHEPTCVSLFSGIGGLDHGLAEAGFRHLLLCESDEWRRGVLAARFPGVPIADDVREVAEGSRPRGLRALGGGDDIGHDHPDLLCGGFPCQDLSVAGNRAGLAGDRSGLFFELARVIDALRPRWFLLENVPGLLSSEGGRDFGVVLGTLADLGYGVAWRILDSRFFGVPQRRQRVFIVGTLADGDPRAAAERASQVLAVGTRCSGHPATRGEARPDAAIASLSGLGSGGPDDNDAQGGRFVTQSLTAPRHGQRYSEDETLIASTLKSQRGKAGGGIGPAETLIAHALTSEGHDASEDGTGRGTPIVIADTLTSGSHPGSNMPGRRREDDTNLVAHTFDWQVSGSERTWIHDGPEHSRSITANKTLALNSAAGVRRLTPTECERLQSLPDGWTLIPDSAPDSRRYSGLGDAVTSSVAHWIGLRIAQELAA